MGKQQINESNNKYAIKSGDQRVAGGYKGKIRLGRNETQSLDRY